MLVKLCRLCLKTPESDEKLTKNWQEIIKKIEFLFKIDLVSLSSGLNGEQFGVCYDCNETLNGVHEFYEMILKAKQQLSQIDEVVEQKSDEPGPSDKKTSVGTRKKPPKVDVNRIEPPKKRKILTRSCLAAVSESICNNKTEDLSVSIERKEQNTDEDLKLSQFFSFSCPDCPKVTFPKFSYYKSHMRKLHKIPYPAIICCKQRYGKRWRLLEHMSYHLNPEKFKCPECDRQFTARDRIENHRKQVHGPQEELTHECPECKRRFRVMAGLKAHLFTHMSKEERESLKNYICDHCGNKFVSKFLLVQHIRQSHTTPNPFVCDICAKIYKSKTQFLYHHKTMHQDTPTPKVQCKKCHRLCLNEQCLKAHMKTVHSNDGPHICDICQKESPTSRALKSHKMYVHESVRRFSCSFCEKAFKKDVELKEHIKIHIGGAALYSCQYCDKTFNSSANMYSHRKRMHPVEHLKIQEAKRGVVMT